MGTENKNTSKESALLKKWLQRKRATKTSEQPAAFSIPARPAGEPIPLSSGQLRLWFLQQLHPDNPFYHYAEAYRLRGPLHVEQLQKGFEQIAENHDILRTSFPTQNGVPVQVIVEQVNLEWTQHDLSKGHPQNPEAAAEQLAIEAAQQPFDLSHGPLTRITLIQLGEEDHLLVVTMHHIITDKWSMQVLREMLAEVYPSGSSAEQSLTRPTIQYADFAHWQKQQTSNAKHLAYWEQKLAGDLPFLKLPMDRERPVRPTFRGKHQSQTFSKPLSERLIALSKQANTTPFVLFLAAFKVLLYRYTRQEDILIGTPITDRDQVALEKLIGFFNNTVVLRSDLSGNPTFMDLVEQVRKTALEAFEHKNIQFESLVRRLQPERYTSTNPLFQVMFLYHKVPEVPSFSPDLSLEYKPLDFGVAKFDLTLYISERTRAIKRGIRIRYRFI